MPALDTTPRTQGEVPLPDGRVLAYAEYGPADGAPVLFVPGAASGRLMNVGGPALGELGIRLVSVDRPGLGRSTVDPAKSLTSVARDLGVLVHRLASGPVPAVANSQGAPFGLAAAAAGVVSRLVVVSPADEVARPDLRSLLPAHLAAVVEQATADPAGARALFAGLGPSSMFAMLLGAVAEVDAPVYGDDVFRSHLRRVLDDGFAQGSDGYADDTLLAMRPWGLALDRIDVPVQVWHGDLDHGHSPDLGRSLAERIPTAAHHVVPGAGGSLLWAHPEPILAASLSDLPGPTSR